MGKQKKDWGSVEWMDNGTAGLFQSGMNVGVITLDVGAHQHKHLHYEEQAVYVIQGQAISIIDKVETSLTPGTFFHWPAGITHEIFNIGNIPFQHLLISNPNQDGIEDLMEKSRKKGGQKKEELTGMLYLAVDTIRKQFLDNLQYAYAIYDWAGNLIIQSNYVPGFCSRTCGKAAGGEICECMIPKEITKFREECTVFCSHGMEIFNVPVFYGEDFLGYVQGGYIYQSHKCPKTVENIYDTPDSTAIGIQKLLRKIVKSIQSFCDFEEVRMELLEKESEISDSQKAQNMLLQNLQDAEYEMTDLRINNHFLFNTLNGMASMALEGGQMPLYQSIVDLSKMFHYTLRTQETVVTLKKEVEYIRAYLQLQKLRYGEKLEMDIQIEDSLLNQMVPFNFLQPIVENAFIHGFSEADKKEIEILAIGQSGKLVIEVKNTGRVLSEEETEAVNERMKSGTAHGMAMIYHKLSAVYGEDFRFRFVRNCRVGMGFLIELPLDREVEP